MQSGRVWKSMGEYGRVLESMGEYSNAVWESMEEDSVGERGPHHRSLRRLFMIQHIIIIVFCRTELLCLV